MRTALIARADSGGLGTLTQEYARHVRPDRTVIMQMGERGGLSLDRFDLDAETIMVAPHPIPDDTWAWLLDGTDVLYTAEYGYRQGWANQARDAGVRTVLHAMPELYGGDPADLVLVPTSWEQHRLPHSVRFGVPIAADRLPWRLHDHARTFLCAPGPAFHDRDGWNIVLAAIPFIRTEVRILLRPPSSDDWVRPRRVPPNVTLEYVEPWAEYWQVPTYDVLLLPRRFGGLSMPMQEAAALGRPTIGLTREPLRGFLSRPLLAKGRPSEQVAMKGGRFDVWDVDPRHYAAVIDNAVHRPELVEEASILCGQWAEENTWAIRADDYRDALRSTLEDA